MDQLVNKATNLIQILKKMNYDEEITLTKMDKDNPVYFFELLKYILINYSNEFYKLLIKKNYNWFACEKEEFFQKIIKLYVI